MWTTIDFSLHTFVTLAYKIFHVNRNNDSSTVPMPYTPEVKLMHKVKG